MQSIKCTRLLAPVMCALLAPAVSCCLAVLSTRTAMAQEAYVYDYMPNVGVYAYDASSTGKLAAIKGSPFKVTGQMVGTDGSYFVSADSTKLYAYKVESNGAIGKEVSHINTQLYTGSECGTISGNLPTSPGAQFDHTGQNIYVRLSGAPGNPYAPDYDQGACDGIQTYGVSKSGVLTFKGVTELNQGSTELFTGGLPTLTGNSKFGYGFEYNDENGDLCDGDSLNLFSTESNGTLEYQNRSFENPFASSQGSPALPPGAVAWQLEAITDDPTDHIALAMYWTDDTDCEDYPVTSGPTQLASFTVDGQGNLTTTNTYETMPQLPGGGGTDLMKLDPTGKILAAAAGTGVAFFHFNGANPITPFTGIIGVSGYIPRMAWDNDDHLYAQNGASGKLHVYEVTTQGAKELPGSPTVIPQSTASASPSSIIVRTK